MYLKIKVLSKNKKSIENFLNFFFKKTIFSIVFGKLGNKNKTKKFTILKSPHVNKVAQEQFEYRLTITEINLYTLKILKFLIFIKNLQNNLFSDVKIEIEVSLKGAKGLKRKIFNPDKFKNSKIRRTNVFKLTKRKINIKNKVNYIKMFDIFGETLVKN